MFKRIYIFVGLAMISGLAYAQQDFKVSGLDQYRIQKIFLQDGANSKPLNSRNGEREIISGFYNQISLNALAADYHNSTRGLRSFLADLSNVGRSDALVSCLGSDGDGGKRLLREFQDALKKSKSSLESMDDFIDQPISVGSMASSRFGFRQPATSSGREEARDFKEHMATLETYLGDMKDCCLDEDGKANSAVGCNKEFVKALNSSDEYEKIKMPRGDYPNPLVDVNMPADELAYFLAQDPIMQQAKSNARATGDYTKINMAWSEIQTQCLVDKDYILSKEIKKKKNMMAIQDIAKAVQCTMPSYFAHNGSYTAFQASLAIANLPIRTQTHQFGCAPGMLEALADIRTTDHGTLTQRYGTDKIVPTWVFQNPNDTPVIRRSFVQQAPNGLATSNGFIANVPEANGQAVNPRAPSVVPQQNPFLANVPVNTARGPASARMAPSRGNVPRGRSLARKTDIQDSRDYALGVRSLASKIESGDEPHKNARLLAKGASTTRGFVKRVAASLGGRGASRVRQERRSLASVARFGVKKAAVTRGVARGARTSARDTLAFFQQLQKDRVIVSQNNNNNNSNQNPQTPTTVGNTSNVNPNGNSSNWDNASQAPKADPWAKLRKTQAALDSQIMAKNNFIDNIVTKINQVAAQFGDAKRDMISKYSAPIINTKIAGKTPDQIVSTLSGIRQEAFGKMTHIGSLNAQINELKGRLVAEESSLGNLLMMRGAASGNPTSYNPSPLLQNMQPPVPTGFPQNSPFTQNPSLPNTPVPQTSIDSSLFSWNFLEEMIPNSWAAPGLQERLDSYDQWVEAVGVYAKQLDEYSLKLQEEQNQAKAELYDSYSEFYWLEENPEQMTDLRMDLVAGISHYNKTLKEEVESLLLKMRTSEGAGSYDRELVDMLERAKNDTTESQQALVKILKMYVESYPAAIEDNPEMWWSQVSRLLLY
ncbi:hypothetical protein GW915_10250 [bacterium]|nr:hypothetical protein [bacterium]